MAQDNTTINPTTTATVRTPGFRGPVGTSQTFKSASLPTTVNATVTLPITIESFPATFFVTTGTERTTRACGFITVYSNSALSVHGATSNFVAAASVGTTADNVGVSISSGNLVFTNPGTNACTAATNLYISSIA